MSRESVELGELIFPAKVIRCGRDEYPVFSMTMHDGIVEQKTRFKKALASKDQSNYKVVKPGQLVVGFPIDEGVLYIQQLGKKGIMSPAYNIWDVDQEKVYPGFLELALHSPQSMSWYKAKLRGTTARRRNIPAKDLIKLRICLPEKSVQSRIVDTFQQIKEELSFFASLNEKLDDLVKSRFVEMFGRIDKIDSSFVLWADVVEIINGKDYKTNQVKSGGYPVYGTGGEIARADSFLCPANSVIVGRKGTINNPLLITEPFWNVDTAFGIVPKENKMHYLYLYWFCKQFDFSQLNKSTTLPSTTKKDLLKIEIKLPEYALQQEFADFVYQVDKLKFDFDFLVSFSIPSICLFCLKLDP